MLGNVLDDAEKEMDLGVIINNCLNYWKQHNARKYERLEIMENLG